MSARTTLTPEVFSTREIARAAGTSTADAEALIASGVVSSLDGEFVDATEAVRAVRLLKGLTPAHAAERPIFRPLRNMRRRNSGPLTASGLLHATAFGLALLTFGIPTARQVEPEPTTSPRLVFLVKPGPGGGGGGGGLRQPDPPRRALLKGKDPLKSPVPVERVVRRPVPDPPAPPKPAPPPPEVTPVQRPIEPPPPVAKPDPVPPIVAPVVSAPADDRDRVGVIDAPPSTSDSQGRGNGGGAGSGGGTGNGEGIGPGIGPGSGGGTGGGPYRPGSGIAAPELIHEVKPDYTEEARRRSLAGDVVLEIVVRSDGRVGSVRVVQGLGAGLDQRAVDAVRQWRFSPARRFGTPVDVVVEVAVEFRLR
jgi:periplasmic protein TonB